MRRRFKQTTSLQDRLAEFVDGERTNPMPGSSRQRVLYALLWPLRVEAKFQQLGEWELKSGMTSRSRCSGVLHT